MRHAPDQMFHPTATDRLDADIDNRRPRTEPDEERLLIVARDHLRLPAADLHARRLYGFASNPPSFAATARNRSHRLDGPPRARRTPGNTAGTARTRGRD